MSQGFDVLREVQRPLPQVEPISDFDLQVLFLALIRFRTFFDEARPSLRPEVFDQFYEAHYILLWTALTECIAEFNGASYDALRWKLQQVANTAALQLTPDGWNTLTEHGPNGIVYSIYTADNLGPDIVELAREILRRLLYERTVASPLRRLVSSSFTNTGAYTENLDVFLNALTDQSRQLQTTGQLPVVQFAPPPGTILQAASQFVSTGLDIIDGPLGGQRRGDVNGIIGVTGGGKTTLAAHLAAAAAKTAYNADPINCEQVAFFSYEEPLARVRPRILAAACYIDRNVLERMTDPAQLATGPASYDHELIPFNPQWANLPVPTEALRYQMAMPALSQALVGFDMSGCEEYPTAGYGHVTEVATTLDRWVQRTSRGVRLVILDWAGLCCTRYMEAQNMDETQLRPLLSGFGELCKRRIAERFNCTVWALHQIRGEATGKRASVKMHHSDAAECKAFATQMSVCGCIGPADSNTGCRLLNWSKVRYRPETEVPCVTIRIHERFAQIQDVSSMMTLDDSGQHLVLVDDANRIRGAAAQTPPAAVPEGQVPAGLTGISQGPLPATATTRPRTRHGVMRPAASANIPTEGVT